MPVLCDNLCDLRAVVRGNCNCGVRAGCACGGAKLVAWCKTPEEPTVRVAGGWPWRPVPLPWALRSPRVT